MFSVARVGFAFASLAVLASLAGCASGSGEPPAVAAATPVTAAPYVGLTSGALGENLDASAKTAANNAELAALASGERKTWRGDNGAYGYIAPSAGSGDCRDFNHTIYINGRPRTAKGTACRAGDSWKLNS